MYQTMMKNKKITCLISKTKHQINNCTIPSWSSTKVINSEKDQHKHGNGHCNPVQVFDEYPAEVVTFPLLVEIMALKFGPVWENNLIKRLWS